MNKEFKEHKDCPIIAAHCARYRYLQDSNGEVAVCFCSHPYNPSSYEGNCLRVFCPLTKPSRKHS